MKMKKKTINGYHKGFIHVLHLKRHINTSLLMCAWNHRRSNMTYDQTQTTMRSHTQMLKTQPLTVRWTCFLSSVLFSTDLSSLSLLWDLRLRKAFFHIPLMLARCALPPLVLPSRSTAVPFCCGDSNSICSREDTVMSDTDGETEQVPCCTHSTE